LLRRPRTTVLAYEWDLASNLKHVTQDGVVVLGYEYDAMNRPNLISDVRGGRSFNLSYSPRGELTQVLFPSGVRKVQTWGARGELLSIQYKKPDATVISQENYAYDAELQLVSITDQVGLQAVFQYDLRGRLVRADYRGGDYEVWAYDSCGNMVSYQRPTQTQARTHDLADQLTRIESTAAGGSTTVTVLVHDPRGNLRRLTKAGEDREFVWDHQCRLRSVLSERPTEALEHVSGRLPDGPGADGDRNT